MRSDLNYALEINASRKDWCLWKAADSLIEGTIVTGNCSHTINMPRITKTDSQRMDPGHILQPSVDSAINNMDILEFSGIPDDQASAFATVFSSINYWPISVVGGLDNCWEHLNVVESKREMEVDLVADISEEQAIDSCWEWSQEIDCWFLEPPRILLVLKTIAIQLRFI